VFSGGGEKPPEITDTSGQDEDEDVMLPGFSYAGADWWGKEEESGPTRASANTAQENGYGRREPAQANDDFIPGFGASEGAFSSRQGGQLPSQEDTYGSAGGEEWNRGSSGVGAGGRSSRWGTRRGGPRY
jgi:polyadenylation factor subunit 2